MIAGEPPSTFLLPEVAASDDRGRTALHLAAFNGRIEVVQLLLSSGAEVAVSANGEMTAIMVLPRMDTRRRRSL